MGIRRFFRRGYWDDERARELDAYLAQEIDDDLARGMTPDQARMAAHRKLGNATRIREEIYTMNSLGFLETLWQDLRYGARLLRRPMREHRQRSVQLRPVRRRVQPRPGHGVCPNALQDTQSGTRPRAPRDGAHRHVPTRC